MPWIKPESHWSNFGHYKKIQAWIYSEKYKLKEKRKLRVVVIYLVDGRNFINKIFAPTSKKIKVNYKYKSYNTFITNITTPRFNKIVILPYFSNCRRIHSTSIKIFRTNAYLVLKIFYLVFIRWMYLYFCWQETILFDHRTEFY